MVSPDSGESWNSFMVLENGKGKKPDAPWVEYSYPAIIESRSGSLIVTYTSKRKQICFCEILLCSKKKD
jgi:predicted neuraminidase